LNNKYHGFAEWTFPGGIKKKGEFVNGNRTRWIEVIFIFLEYFYLK
jgi:hypothetical protein